jgi:hypothetical protein
MYLTTSNAGSGAGPITFSVQSGSGWRFNTAGNLQALGSNAGIQFNKSGALTNSVLNDYEVGTWTPTVATGGVTLGTINYATYVKIGRVVVVNTYCDVTSMGNTNEFQVAGLPFTVASNAYSPGSLDVGQYGVVGAYVRADGGTTNVSFLYPSTTSSSRISVKGNQVSGYLIFTLTYHTTS